MGLPSAFLLCVALISLSSPSFGVVTTFDDKSFARALEGNEVVIVNFYTPWCHACKRIEGIYEKVAQQLRKHGVLCAKLDATAYPAIADDENVAAYPTLKVYLKAANGETESLDYEGVWKTDDIVHYVLSAIGPAVLDMTNDVAQQVHDIVVDGMSCMVAVLPSGVDDPDISKTFGHLASKYRGSLVIGSVATPSQLGEWSGKAADNQILLFTDWHEEPFLYQGALSIESIQEWFERNRAPTYEEITPANYKFYTTRGLPIVWLFLEKEGKAKLQEEALDSLRMAADMFCGTMSFVFLDGRKYQPLAQKMGLSGTRYPAVVIEDVEGNHFTLSEVDVVGPNELLGFIKKFIRHEVTPALRSEPIPDNPVDVDGVTVVVGSTFKNIVTSAKDVLILFTAPLCPHCQRLIPIFSQLAKLMARIPTITVAKMDGTANGAPKDFVIDDFPSIYLAPAGATPLQYQGEHTVSSILFFVQMHARHKVNVTYTPEKPEVDMKADPMLHGEDEDSLEYVVKAEYNELRERVQTLEREQRELLAALKQMKDETQRLLREKKLHVELEAEEL